jgi:putative hydrolase of the HAD superfamily
MLDHIDSWIFDLDNTLYPASANLFSQIDVKMGAYIQKLLNVDQPEAHRIQKQLFHSHGMTLPGLMANHGVDPHHFLGQVHDVDVDVVTPHPELADLIARLPGRKFVFTNADAPYAERVLARTISTRSIMCLSRRPRPMPACARRTASIRLAPSLSRTWRATWCRPRPSV